MPQAILCHPHSSQPLCLITNNCGYDLPLSRTLPTLYYLLQRLYQSAADAEKTPIDLPSIRIGPSLHADHLEINIEQKVVDTITLSWKKPESPLTLLDSSICKKRFFAPISLFLRS